MKDHRVGQVLVALAVVLLVIGLSGLSGAQAQTAAVSSREGPVAKAPAPVKAPSLANFAAGDAVLSVTGSALRPRASDITFAATGDGGGIYCTGTGGSHQVFNTPLDLPQGTLVKSLRMYFYDNDISAACYGFFTIYDLNGNFVSEWSPPRRSAASARVMPTPLPSTIPLITPNTPTC